MAGWPTRSIGIATRGIALANHGPAAWVRVVKRVAFDIGVSRQAPNVESIARQKCVGASKLARDRVVIARFEVVKLGEVVRVLCGDAVVS